MSDQYLDPFVAQVKAANYLNAVNPSSNKQIARSLPYRINARARFEHPKT
jgi:hypothetical protein